MGKTIAFVLCVSLCCVESYRIFPLPGQSEAPLNPKFGLFNFKSASSSLVTVTSAPKFLPITPSRTTVAPSIPIPTSRLSTNIASSRSEAPTSFNGLVQKFSSNFASTGSITTESHKIATNFQKNVEHIATDLLPPKKVSVTPAPKPLPTSSQQTSGPSQIPSLASRLSFASQKPAALETPNVTVNRLSSNVAPQTFLNGPSNHVETLARDLLPPKEDVKTTVGRSIPVKQALQLATDLVPPKTS